MTNKEFFINCWKSEIPATVNVIKALPDSKMDFKSDPKARTAKSLVGHIVAHNEDVLECLETGNINHRIEVDFSNNLEAGLKFSSDSDKLLKKIESIPDADWEGKMTTFNLSGNKLWEAPLSQMLWGFLFDTIHHRGQLSTYVRPMGGKNPSIYGPTADTMEAQQQQAS